MSGARGFRPRSPIDVALHELKRLKALDLPARGKMEEFHTLLANVVRRFLEKQYHVPARRTTTQEVSALLDQTERITGEDKEFVQRFLQSCDLGKFAGLDPPVCECDELARETEEFLRRASRS